MGLKDYFNKAANGLALPAIDKYLMKEEENDRIPGVNSPSQSGNCNRQNYYARMGEEKDDNRKDPRTERIFGNGNYVHDRLQTTLEKAGILLMREVPVFNLKYNILGHTDGLLSDAPAKEVVILEIKSIKDNGFTAIRSKGVKPEHISQGNVYGFCLETHRLDLQKKYSTKEKFLASKMRRARLYASFYDHLTDGSKYTKKEKIQKRVKDHLKCDNILFNLKKPITRISFLYENKDNQEIKEFLLKFNKPVMEDIKEKFLILEKSVKRKKPPAREGKNKSAEICHWCNFKVECWN